jgi:hypothetical protein
VSAALGLHGYQLPTDKLDPIVLAKDSKLDQPIELGERPAPPRKTFRSLSRSVHSRT